MVKETNGTQTWGTGDELLLACAVKRHGFKNWDSVAMEVQTRTSLPHLLTTAQTCRQKYRDLKRRFTLLQDDDEEDAENNESRTGGDKVESIPWLEELRKVRVAELRREVQRYDVSILSLQLKVKRLEEEREQSLQQDRGSHEKGPDLGNDSKGERSGEGEEEAEAEAEAEKPAGKKSGEESDRENRSVNESNSTGSDPKRGEGGAEREGRGVKAEDSCNRKSGVSQSEELGDSVTQVSGSSASMGRKGRRRRRRRRRRKEMLGDDQGVPPVKSEPLIRLLELIRAHPQASLFERRLRSQESNQYKSLVRQHMDVESIQAKMEQGCYSSSSLAFFKDLLILFNNAIVFFPKASIESISAHHLRSQISNQIKNKSESPAPSPPVNPHLQRSDSLLARQKSSAPLIVSRKRSSISTKPSSGFASKADHPQTDELGLKEKEKEKDKEKEKEKDKPVTGTRSTRRSSKNPVIANPNKKQTTANSGPKPDKLESPKTEKKKSEALGPDKKRSVADFLKRIKKNSPAETAKRAAASNNKGGGEQKKKSSNNNGKKEKGKERVLRSDGEKKKGKEEISPSKRTVGRPPKKEAENPETLGKRGREGHVKEKQQRKRSRR